MQPGYFNPEPGPVAAALMFTGELALELLQFALVLAVVFRAREIFHRQMKEMKNTSITELLFRNRCVGII
jgi:hypothetical protein